MERSRCSTAPARGWFSPHLRNRIRFLILKTNSFSADVTILLFVYLCSSTLNTVLSCSIMTSATTSSWKLAQSGSWRPETANAAEVLTWMKRTFKIQLVKIPKSKENQFGILENYELVTESLLHILHGIRARAKHRRLLRD